MPSLEILILAAGIGSRLKAVIPKPWILINGISICVRMIREVLKINPDRILVRCDPAYNGKIESIPKVVCLPKTGKLLRDILDGVTQSGADLLVVVNVDAVLLSSNLIHKIIKLAEMNSETGLIWPAVPREKCYSEQGSFRYIPGSTLVRGGIWIIRPKLLHIDKQLLERMIKFPAISELFVMRLEGVVRFLLHWALHFPLKWFPRFQRFEPLAPRHIANLLGYALGCKAEIVEVNDPEVAFDIDLPPDLPEAIARLKMQGRY
ncbi:MAG: NTP transferase domain-containing protein [Candidatus Berkelbacteria bacterium]